MRKDITEEMLAFEIRKAKRFNDIAFLATIIFTAVLIFMLFRVNKHTTFSSRYWKEDHANRRYMLGSLLEQHKLYNMGKEELIELLGYDQHKWNSENNDCLTYYLGRSALTGEEEWLMIQMESDIVKSYRICSK